MGSRNYKYRDKKTGKLHEIVRPFDVPYAKPKPAPFRWSVAHDVQRLAASSSKREVRS